MPLEVRPLRMREVPRVAWVMARTMEATARDDPKPDGTRRSRLHRVRATYPPRPWRFGVILLTYAGSLATMPTWVGRDANDLAALSVLPLHGPGRYAWRLRAMALGVPLFLLFVAWVIGFTVAATQWPSAVIPIATLFLGGLLLPCLPLVWPATDLWRNRHGRRLLREAKRQAVADAGAGAVLWAAGLGSGDGGAGVRLARVLAEQAEAQGATVLAITEDPLPRIYQRFGCDVIASATMTWGTAVLVQRRPAKRR